MIFSTNKLNDSRFQNYLIKDEIFEQLDEQISLYNECIRKKQQSLGEIMTQFDTKLIGQARKTKGYLYKKSNATFSNWKKKYFIFLEDSLSIFNDETLQSLQKSIMFSSIEQVTPLQQFIIEIRLSKKTYYLKTKSTADQDLWIASINILRENFLQNRKCSFKKSVSNSMQSLEKQSLGSSVKSTSHLPEKQNNCLQSPSRRIQQKEKITYLLRQKQLFKFLVLLGMQKLSLVTKEQKYLRRILFIQDKKHGIFFCLSSKSIYPVIDCELVRQDFIYPYQLNVLYFLSISTYKYAIENKINTIKLQQICKCNEILQSTLFDPSTIKLQIHCQKPTQIQVKQLSESNVIKLLQCVKKMIEVGRQYWSTKGKLLRNIDQFVERYYDNQGNELVFYKMIEAQFLMAINFNAASHSKKSEKKQVQIHLYRLENISQTLKQFIDACEIKSPPLEQLKEKYLRLYHKFVYNYLNQKWNMIYGQATQEQLILYAKKVHYYYSIISAVNNDLRVKEGAKTLIKIVLGRFFRKAQNLGKDFINVEEESLRILKKIQIQKQQSSTISNNLTGNKDSSTHIFFSTFCTNVFSLLSTQFHCFSELPKQDQFIRMVWNTMIKICKISFQSLSHIAQSFCERSSLISVVNSLRLMKNMKISELMNEMDKSPLISYKKEKQEFIKEITYQISLVETFCVKKLFIITFSSINKDLLKHQIPRMDFNKICSIVIQEINHLQYILPEVRLTMFQSAFEEVCYFFYICVMKYENKTLSKDQCLAMINQKMTAIRDCFIHKVDQEKIMNLLKDLNLIKQFITSPINNIKSITRQLKRVFNSNFTQLSLKNLISLRVLSLKQKQHLFEQCRQQIKSSYNSNEEIESYYQRQSFFNGSSGRQRVSTLTQSLKSYTEQFQKVESIGKKQRTVLFGVQNSIYEGYLWRKKIIKNYNNSTSTYGKYFYRLKKGKLLEYDNQFCDDVLNCYFLFQLKKCYPEPQHPESFHLQFQKEMLRFKTSNSQDTNQWIMKILQSMEEQKNIIDLNQIDQQGVLFQDLDKKITFETKDTNQSSIPKDKNKMKKKTQIQANNSPQGKISLLLPKKTQNISPMELKKINGSLSKNKPIEQSRNKPQLKKKESEGQRKKRSKDKGCGTGCNFF